MTSNDRVHLEIMLDGEILPVEVTPLQAHDFTGAKTKTCRDQYHRVVWLDQLRQKETDLARRQHARYASATAALSYQVDGVSVG
jgi:predicted transcriptional regulator